MYVVAQGLPSESSTGDYGMTSCDHHHKAQMEWLKTTEVYCHSSGGQKVKIKVLAGLAPSAGPRGESSLASSSSGGSWCSILVTPVSSSVSKFPSL